MLLPINLHRIVKEHKNKDEYIPPHSHPFFHCIYVFKGLGEIIVDNKKILAQKGMFIRINPNIVHSIYGVENFQSYDIKFTTTNDIATMLEHSPIVFTLNAYEASLIKNIFHLAIKKDTYAEEIINCKITELILLLEEKSERHEHQETNLPCGLGAVANNLLPALLYIDTNLASPLSVEFLAELCSYNPSYFSTMFKKATGYSPLKYINLKKIEKAKELMISTSYSISQIAELIAMDPAYFSKIFKSNVGISPIHYYNRANSDLGINVSQKSPFLIEADFEIPKINTEK